MMNIPIYNCLIEDMDDTTGVYAISFVDYPANEIDFIALSRQRELTKLNKDCHKQILTGVVLQPNQLIYRYSEKLGEYYIRFSEKEIEKIAHKMMRTGIALHCTTHQHYERLEGNYLVELWIVENPDTDKSKALGFENLPKGTLMCSYKIENNEYWENEVMSGHVKGFSLEGFFNQQLENNHSGMITNKKIANMKDLKKKKSLLKRVANLLLDIQSVQKADKTSSGEALLLFVLKNSKEVRIDGDGFATMDGEQMPAGEHVLANNNLLVIDELGQFMETCEQIGKNKQSNKIDSIESLRSKTKKELLMELDEKTTQELKEKIAEMQASINELTQALQEAQSILEETQTQVEEMRKYTPSAQPRLQRMSFSDNTGLSTTERMAVALNQRINRNK